MKIIVDKMPKNENDCPFSKWKPYPPIVEKTGFYKCKFDHEECELSNKGCCRWLREISN